MDSGFGSETSSAATAKKIGTCFGSGLGVCSIASSTNDVSTTTTFEVQATTMMTSDAEVVATATWNRGDATSDAPATNLRRGNETAVNDFEKPNLIEILNHHRRG